MQTLVNRTARELAREYFNGRLSFNDYRESRRKLVDQVTGVDPDPEEGAQTEPVPSPVVEASAPASDVSGAAVQDVTGESRRSPLAAILLLVIAGSGVAGWLLFSGDSEAPPEPLATTAQEPTPVMQTPTETDRVGQLVSDFVQADDWSNDALADFVLAWSALDVADQERARAASDFQPLVEGLREQILEQRALGDMADTDGRETVLMSFASHLDVLPDMQQAVTDTGADRSEPVTIPSESVAKVQEEVPPAEVDEPAPEIVQPVEDTVVPAPAVEAQPEPAAEEVPPPEAVTSTVIKPAAKPVPVPAPEPVSEPVKVVEPAALEDRCPASLVGTRRPVCRDTLEDGDPGPVLVVLPAGSFQMGSPRKDNEQPVHPVKIGHPFAISAYEISRAEYQHFCRTSGSSCQPGHWSGDQDPMTNVSWNDASAYAQWLSQVSGNAYRLPSEAEWEYAARAGTSTEYPFSEGDKILPTDARFDADSPLPVNDKSVNANRFRLRHIIGNVREWVADVWLDDYQGAPGNGSARLQPDTGKRTVRGGSYTDDASRLRSAARRGLSATTRDKRTGFRVVREIRK